MPTLHIIAGPNGVGKTTFADRFLPQTIKELEFVNADLIARGLSPYDPDAVSMEAGRIALERIRHLVKMRQSFTWETTMSGRTAAVWIKSERIRQRVHEGGHNIDPNVSRRRFLKTIQNFFSVYRPLCDAWKLFVNDRKGLRLVAIEKDGHLVTRDKRAFQEIIREAEIII